MFNKNDPLINAVQQVMQKSVAERNAEKLVNEKFGVVSRNALPHEKQSEWKAAYQEILSEELKGNQHKIDVASSNGKKEPDGKLTSHDFKELRAKKTVSEATEDFINSLTEEQIELLSMNEEGMWNSIKNFVMNPQGIKKLPSYQGSASQKADKTHDAIQNMNKTSAQTSGNGQSGPNRGLGSTPAAPAKSTAPAAPKPKAKPAAPVAPKAAAPKAAAPKVVAKPVKKTTPAQRLQSKTQRDDIAGPTRK